MFIPGPLRRLLRRLRRLRAERPPPLATTVLDQRQEPWRGRFVLALLGAALLAAWGVSALRSIDVAEYAIGTIIYRRAVWASHVATAAFGVTLLAGAVWLLAASARGVVGLPAPRRRTWRGAWIWLRAVALLIFVYQLGMWAGDEYHARGSGAAASRIALTLGLLGCGLLAYDAPRLLWNAFVLFRLRPPVGRARRTAIADLKPGMRVRVRGTIDDRTVALRAPGSFTLEAGGARVHVDIDPARTLATAVSAGAGDEVEVIGEVAASIEGEAYRGGLARLTAGERPLFILTGEHAHGRRLYTAAAIEAVAGVALVACPLALVAIWWALASFVR